MTVFSYVEQWIFLEYNLVVYGFWVIEMSILLMLNQATSTKEIKKKWTILKSFDQIQNMISQGS